MSWRDIDNYMPILQRMAKECKGGYVLELGVGQADGSTKAFAEGLTEADGHVLDRLMISVDQIQDFDIKNAPPHDFWHLLIGSSTEPFTVDAVLQISGHRSPDILFIDTDHTYEQMQKELALWSQIADEGTVWLFHDTYMFGGYNPMADAIKEFARDNGWEYSDIDTGSHGLGMMRWKR